MDKETKDYIDKLFAEYVASSPTTKGVGANGVFKPTITKWFRDDNGNIHGSRMARVVPGSGPDVWTVWEMVRKITLKMCGKSRVEHIRDIDKANRYADALCQCVYDSILSERSGNER